MSLPLGRPGAVVLLLSCLASCGGGGGGGGGGAPGGSTSETWTGTLTGKAVGPFLCFFDPDSYYDLQGTLALEVPSPGLAAMLRSSQTSEFDGSTFSGQEIAHESGGGIGCPPAPSVFAATTPATPVHARKVQAQLQLTAASVIVRARFQFATRADALDSTRLVLDATEIADGRVAGTWRADPGPASSAVFASNGTFVLVRTAGGGTPPPPPGGGGAPQGVAASPGNGKVLLTWSPVAGAASYAVYAARQAEVTRESYASLPGGRRVLVASGSSVELTGLPAGTWFFVVTAISAAGESAESAEVSGAVWTAAPASIAAGGGQSCARLSDGSVFCWGSDGLTSSASPARVPDLDGSIFFKQATAIAVGSSHACALGGDTYARCWGSNGAGQLGDGTTAASAAPKQVPLPLGTTGVAAGGAHSCAIVSNGDVMCWGSNGYGQLGDGGTTSSLAPVAVQSVTGATSLAAGPSFTCAVTGGGNVQCWGARYDAVGGGGGAPWFVPGVTGAVQVAAGETHACARMTGGTVRCWGYDDRGQLGRGGAVCVPGPTLCSDPAPNAAAEVPGISGAVSISAAASGTCAVLLDGTVRCWGEGRSGELGNGLGATSTVPVTVSGITSAVEVASGASHTCARLSGGGISCWGAGGSGQLGNRATANATSPVAVYGF